MEILSPLNQSILQWDKNCEDESLDNFELTMAMNGGSGQENGDGYMTVDQTFHTPSFGDEEFDIPPINLQPTSANDTSSNDMYGSTQPLTHQQQSQQVNGNQNQHMSSTQQMSSQGGPPPCSQSMAMGNSMGDRGVVMTTVASCGSANVNSFDDRHHQYTGPPNLNMGHHQDMYMVQIGGGNMLPPQPVQFHVQQYSIPTSYSNGSMEQQHRLDQHHPVPSHHIGASHHPHHLQQHHQPLLGPSSMLALQLGPPRQPRPGSVGSSPPGSNQTSPGLETSEDSDDSGHLTQLMGGIKRPSPEPVERPPSVGKPVKKPKTQKKKKKRDPNEPQKPVSAYALFFRDTQAAIKGQNPNASFGEVSKIVASMWDGLEIDHKNVYKKKTEAAKKEYLKALAAYRASLVSKAANDQSDNIYGGGTPGSTTPTSSPMTSAPSQTLSPLQKKSPLLTSLMEGTAVSSLQNMTQPQPLLVGQASMGGMHHPHMLAQHLPPHQGGQVSHQMLHQMLSPSGQLIQIGGPQSPQMMGHHPMPPGHGQPQQGGPINNNNLSYSPGMMNSSQQMQHQGQEVSQGMMCSSPLQNTCLRNPGDQPQEWERDYCNNDCVVSHCRDVFTTWVASRPPPNTYASVK